MQDSTCYHSFNHSGDKKVVPRAIRLIISATDEFSCEDSSAKTQSTIYAIEYVCNDQWDCREVAWLRQSILISKIIHIKFIYVLRVWDETNGKGMMSEDAVEQCKN